MARYKQEKYVESKIVDKLNKIRAIGSDGLSKGFLEDLFSGVKEGELDRFLIDLFEYALWEEDKINLIVILGKASGRRGTEFLISFIETSQNMKLVSEAVLALSESKTLMAFHFLFYLLDQTDKPFQREALIALGSNKLFSFSQKLISLLKDKDSSSSLKVLALLSSGQNLKKKDFPFILENLEGNFLKEPALFNAGLLAAGRLGGKVDIQKILAFDTRFRFFAKELQEYAVNRILLKESLSKENIFEALEEEAYDSKEFIIFLEFLRSFEREDILSYLEKTKIKKNKNKEALVRLFFRDRDFLKEDQEFYLSFSEDLDGKILAYYFRFCVEQGFSLESKKLAEALSFEKFLVVFLDASFPKIFESLVKKINSNHLKKEEKISLINIFVSQVFMKAFSQREEESAVKILLNLVQKDSENIVRGRALRALCQIRRESEAKILEIKDIFKKGLLDEGSFLYFLKSSHTAEASEILLEFLKKSVDKKESGKTYYLIEALSSFSVSLDLHLDFLTEDLKKSSEAPLLKLLGNQKIEGFNKFIEKSLLSSFSDIVLLSLRAFEKNPFSSSWGQVQSLTQSSSEALKYRSLKVLCEKGGFEEHKFLFQNFLEKEAEAEDRLFLLKNILPKKDFRYEKISEFLVSKLTENHEMFEVEELFSAAVSLQDRFKVILSQKNNEALTKEEQHALDKKIVLSLPEYSRLSGTIKSVLRNAELTWDRKDLFDSLVDKSTMIIEYTKSIEIMIQEKIENSLFKDPKSLTQTLQNRLFFLKLNEPYLSTRQIITRLRCFSYFSDTSFPKNKFKALTKSILSGNFSYDRYRTLDGLRAWSLMFLIYFRDFETNGKKLKSLVPLSDNSSKTIGDFASSLNNLQESRNIAAHRGTLFNLEKIGLVRNETFKVLERLTILFP